MNFEESSHKADWQIMPEELEELRHNNLQRALAASAATSTPDQESASASAGSVTTAEEQLLLRYYGGKVPLLTQQLGLPRKVMLTALVFLKRFYLSKSVLEADPARFMLTSIYLACKAEESYISADDFCRAVQQDPAVVLQNEVALLQGLRFDLVVHQPLWSLQGFFADFDAWRGDASSGADAVIRSAPAATLQQAHGAAKTALTSLMLTDAPLIHPPGSLALAAMQTGFMQQQLCLDGFLRHVAQKSAASRGTDSDAACSSGADAALTTLQQRLASINLLAQQGTQTISEAQVKEIDRKCKAQKKRKAAAPKQ